MYRLILFGAGGYLRDRIDEVFSFPDTQIIGMSDNNKQLFGTLINGVIVEPLEKFSDDQYDYIVITSLYADDIARDLEKKGYLGEKIKRLYEYGLYLRKDDFLFFSSKTTEATDESEPVKSALIVSVDLTFNGASIAAAYMLMALQRVGYQAAMASYMGEESFIEYLNSKGIDAWICPNILYEKHCDLEWFNRYDLIIANDLVVHNFIRNYSGRKIIWWLHESDRVYEEESKLWGRIDSDIWDKTRVFCVSKGAEENYHRYYPEIEAGILEYGIPDMLNSDAVDIQREQTGKDKLIFALIGFVGERKGQDIFLNAVSQLGDIRDQVEFWIIGRILEGEYSDNVLSRAEMLGNVKVMGERTQNEVDELYREIDVVVSASRNDPLPIVITEAMMHEKACIIPDIIGTNRYIDSEKDMMVYETGNSRALAECIRRLNTNRDLLARYGKRGRAVYEKKFSMDAFSKRILRAVEKVQGN